MLLNSQKCRVLWYNCHRTHRSVGYCGATVRTHRSVGCCGTTVTELTEVSGIVVQRSQNSQKCRVLWYNCHRTHRSVGYCIQISQGNLCGVPDVLQNSQKCRVLWCNCHRTHRRIGYCGTAVTELTEVLCRVKTEGNYPRYRSVGTLQNLSVEISHSIFSFSPMSLY